MQIVQNCFCFPDKHAGIPEVLTGVDIFGRFLFVRFLSESFYGINLIFTVGILTGVIAFYVAETGAGKGRLNTKCDHIIRIIVSKYKSILDGLLKYFGRLYDMVGGDYCYCGLRVIFCQNSRDQSDSTGCIANSRLGYNVIKR